MGYAIRWIFAIVMLAGMAGCQSSKMVRSEAAGYAPVPAAGKALVVFLRPSSYGGAIQASLFDTGAQSDQFIGISSSKTKIAWQADPGEHLFMVIGENADFMIAHLDAGKTYYALVSPRTGFWKARFSLLPIHNDASAQRNTGSTEFGKWMQASQWVRNTAEGERWFRDNADDIRAKKDDYMRKWNAGTAQHHEQLTLKATDGM